MKKMLKRHQWQFILAVVLFMTFSTFASAFSINQSQLKPQRKIIPKFRKCDLVITKVELDARCQIKVTIKNQGAAGVADAAYNTPPKKGVAIQASVGNTGWGGYILAMIDPHKKLKNPGESVSYTGFKRPLNPGETISLKMEIINPGNVGNESNLNNNTKYARLTCRKKQCDLVVERIELNRKCQVKVTIKNQGLAGVADGAYNKPPKKGVIIQATTPAGAFGGYILDMFDPGRKLKTAGASVSFTGFKRPLKPGETLSITVKIVNPGNVGNESNLGNNSKSTRLTCRKKR